jgi:hypothetical protein
LLDSLVSRSPAIIIRIDINRRSMIIDHRDIDDCLLLLFLNLNLRSLNRRDYLRLLDLRTGWCLHAVGILGHFDCICK